GYGVLPMNAAASVGDIFITTTGCKDVITGQHFGKMKDGTLLANAGHFNVEISVNDLEATSVSIKQINDNNQEYLLKNGNKIYLIGEGRLVNLAAAEGHPSEVMDMSFANQLLSVLKLANLKGSLSPAVYDVEKSQDQEIAKAKLESMGLQIDVLTPEQRIYLDGFGEGT
ncbi:MAG: adenosylhomocysteinase, partial [Nitrososphaeraceae archaeon]